MWSYTTHQRVSSEKPTKTPSNNTVDFSGVAEKLISIESQIRQLKQENSTNRIQNGLSQNNNNNNGAASKYVSTLPPDQAFYCYVNSPEKLPSVMDRTFKEGLAAEFIRYVQETHPESVKNEVNEEHNNLKNRLVLLKRALDSKDSPYGKIFAVPTGGVIRIHSKSQSMIKDECKKIEAQMKQIEARVNKKPSPQGNNSSANPDDDAQAMLELLERELDKVSALEKLIDECSVVSAKKNGK